MCMQTEYVYVCPLSLAVQYICESKGERPQSLAPKSDYKLHPVHLMQKVAAYTPEIMVHH